VDDHSAGHGTGANLGKLLVLDKIVLTMTGTRLVDPNESVEAQMLYNIVEELSIAAGLPMQRWASWRPWSPTPLPQEEIQIMRWSLPHVAFENTNRDELAGVIAHELSHIKHRDILLTSMAATMALMILTWQICLGE